MHVDLVANDAGVVLTPWPPSIESQLTLERMEEVDEPILTKNGELKTAKVRMKTKTKLWHFSNNAGVIMPAMLEYVRGILQAQGHSQSLLDYRTPCPAPDWDLLDAEPRPGQIEILQLMCASRCALIKASGGLGKTETIAMYRRINPTLRICVVTFTGQVRDSIAARLRDKCPSQTVCILASGLPKFRADTYVVLDKSLHRIDPSELDVLIIDEVHGSGSSAAFDHLCRFCALRVYGMSATPFGRHDGADLAPIALCGLMRIDLDYGFAVSVGANVPLHVFMYEAAGRGDLKKMAPRLREMLGIWRNGRRNALLAHLANNISRDEQSLMVCRVTEHVLRLHKMMPDAVCVFGMPTDEREEELMSMGLLPLGWKGLPQYRTDKDEARKEFEKGELMRAITTPLWKEGVDFVHLRWVIRADGTVNSIFCLQTGYRASRVHDGKAAASIIDTVDRYSGMEYRSMQRVKSYREEGWNVHFVGSVPK